MPVSAVRGTRTKPGVLHRDSAQLMNKIGKIRDELCMCSLHVEYVFSVFKMRLRKRTDTRIQNGWRLGRRSEYIHTTNYHEVPRKVREISQNFPVEQQEHMAAPVGLDVGSKKFSWKFDPSGSFTFLEIYLET